MIGRKVNLPAAWIAGILLLMPGLGRAAEDEWVNEDVSEGPIQGRLSANKNWKRFELHWRPNVAKNNEMTLFEIHPPEPRVRGCNIDVLPFSKGFLGKDTLKQLYANIIPATEIFAYKTIMNTGLPGIGGTLQSTLDDVNAAIRLAQADCQTIANFMTAKAAKELGGSKDGNLENFENRLACAAGTAPDDMGEKCGGEDGQLGKWVKETSERLGKTLNAMGFEEVLSGSGGSLWTNWGVKLYGERDAAGNQVRRADWSDIESPVSEMGECGKELLAKVVAEASAAFPVAPSRVRRMLEAKGTYGVSGSSSLVRLEFRMAGEERAFSVGVADPAGACGNVFAESPQVPLEDIMWYLAGLRHQTDFFKKHEETYRKRVKRRSRRSREALVTVSEDIVEILPRRLALDVALRRERILLRTVNSAMRIPEGQEGSRVEKGRPLLPGTPKQLAQLRLEIKDDIDFLEMQQNDGEGGPIERWLAKAISFVESARTEYENQRVSESGEALGELRGAWMFGSAGEGGRKGPGRPTDAIVIGGAK